ncbi:hypothetical protein DA2_1146 [Desulfovibrio sp. A2]|nr:hypothetical protein DA2_1146 [Desulfovibrio sp. A2]
MIVKFLLDKAAFFWAAGGYSCTAAGIPPALPSEHGLAAPPPSTFPRPGELDAPRPLR